MASESELPHFDFRIVKNDYETTKVWNEHLYMKNYPNCLENTLLFVREVNYSRLMAVVDQIPAVSSDSWPLTRSS